MNAPTHIGRVIVPCLLIAIFGSAPSALGEVSRQSKLDALQSELKNAATAEESFRTDHDHYTRRMWSLENNEGFDPRSNVRILIVHAYDEYCLEGQHDSLGAIWHYDSTVGNPQKGRCQRR